MLDRHVEELTALWNGQTGFLSHSVNYSLSGRRIDIQMTGRVLPGSEQSLGAGADRHRGRHRARDCAARSRQSAQTMRAGLFEHSPVSLWVEDFSAIKLLLDEIRDRGIDDLRIFTDVHPEFVQRCMSEIRVLDVNQETLELFHAPDKPTLLHRLGEVFRDDMERSFREQLIDLWKGKLFQRREVLNYALDGNEVHVLLQFSVLPGHEHDWSLVQVALTDITARKKAETYLEFLGTHDVLTKLYNRSFYVDELNRIERKGLLSGDRHHGRSQRPQGGQRPVGPCRRRCAAPQGRRGARQGDREAGLRGPDRRRRVRPDPARGRRAGGEAVMEEIRRLTELNNQFYPGMPLSLSMGAATGRSGERLEEVVRRADCCHVRDQARLLLRSRRPPSRSLEAPTVTG